MKGNQKKQAELLVEGKVSSAIGVLLRRNELLQIDLDQLKEKNSVEFTSNAICHLEEMMKAAIFLEYGLKLLHLLRREINQADEEPEEE